MNAAISFFSRNMVQQLAILLHNFRESSVLAAFVSITGGEIDEGP